MLQAFIAGAGFAVDVIPAITVLLPVSVLSSM